MPKKKAPELTREEQFRRFIEAAEKVGLDGKARQLDPVEAKFKRLAAKRRRSPAAAKDAG